MSTDAKLSAVFGSEEIGAGFEITPAHLHVARALLCWSRLSLSTRLRIGTKPLQLFECHGQRTANLDLPRVRRLLEAEGVVFFADGTNALLRRRLVQGGYSITTIHNFPTKLHSQRRITVISRI